VHQRQQRSASARGLSPPTGRVNRAREYTAVTPALQRVQEKTVLSADADMMSLVIAKLQTVRIRHSRNSDYEAAMREACESLIGLIFEMQGSKAMISDDEKLILLHQLGGKVAQTCKHDEKLHLQLVQGQLMPAAERIEHPGLRAGLIRELEDQLLGADLLVPD
jgi:hypothetical protein